MSANINKTELDYGAFETDMTAQVAELQNQLHATQLEKDIAVAAAAKALALAKAVEAGAPAAAPGSGKKVNWTSTHQARHDEVVLVTAPVLLELKNLQNMKSKNYHDIIWWFAKHIEALVVGDNPDWHKSTRNGQRIIRMRSLTSTFPLSRTLLQRVHLRSAYC
jgi:hypothetical protein